MNYSFPLLTLPEIALILKEMQLGMTLSEADLTAPDKSAHRIRSVLELLAELTTSTSREEMNQPAFSGLSALSFPELHEDSVPQLNSLRACSKMMEVCGIDDFSIKDLMYPNSKRLRKQLSGIINFVKFREDRMNILNEQTKQRDSLLAALAQCKHKNDDLNKKLLNLREQTAEESKAIAALEAECVAMNGKLVGLNNEQAEIKLENADIKAHNNELKTSISDCLLKLEELGATRKKLSGQIVTSPAKFRKQIADVGQAMQQEQQELRMAERKLKELLSWTTNIDEAQTEVDAALESLLDVKTDVDKQRATANELEGKRSRLVADKENLASVGMALQTLQRQGARSEEKLIQLRRQADMRSRDAQSNLQSLAGHLVEAEGRVGHQASQAQRLEAECGRHEEEVAAESGRQEEERRELMAAYQRLERIIVLHLQRLRRAVEEARGTGAMQCV